MYLFVQKHRTKRLCPPLSCHPHPQASTVSSRTRRPLLSHMRADSHLPPLHSRSPWCEPAVMSPGLPCLAFRFFLVFGCYKQCISKYCYMYCLVSVSKRGNDASKGAYSNFNKSCQIASIELHEFLFSH